MLTSGVSGISNIYHSVMQVTVQLVCMRSTVQKMLKIICYCMRSLQKSLLHTTSYRPSVLSVHVTPWDFNVMFQVSFLVVSGKFLILTVERESWHHGSPDEAYWRASALILWYPSEMLGHLLSGSVDGPPEAEGHEWFTNQSPDDSWLFLRECIRTRSYQFEITLLLITWHFWCSCRYTSHRVSSPFKFQLFNLRGLIPCLCDSVMRKI